MKTNVKNYKQHSAPAPTTANIRCAIYTRKSTEEGLEQEFNTLDAQREAAEAFILSQRHEGWQCVPDHYDDGGYTGGNIERPALKQLLADVESGKVNCVVVYKVDRLSRSLLDFTKIMEVLERHNCSFVSVTQQFNTTHSMGRLTLNILLSFAQFEREIIAERTRDKMSAARRKGRWIGGMPVLGYDTTSRGGELVVNESEAVRVREIFRLFNETQSLIETVRRLNEKKWTMKQWVTRKGNTYGGGRFNKNNLSALLTHRVFIGEVFFKGEVYPAKHTAIVEREDWETANAILDGRRRGSGVKELTTRNKHGAFLRGILRCGCCGKAMVHTHTRKKNCFYRYYVCSTAQKMGWDACQSKAVPAGEIENFVVQEIRGIGSDPAVLAGVLQEVRVRQRSEFEQVRGEITGNGADQNRLHRELKKIADSTVPNMGDTLAELQQRIRKLEQTKRELDKRLKQMEATALDEAELIEKLQNFSPVWDALKPYERERLIQLLVETVEYDGQKGTIRIALKAQNYSHAVAQ